MQPLQDLLIELRLSELVSDRAELLLRPVQRGTPDKWAGQRIYPASAGIPGPRDPGLTPYIIPFERFFDEPRYESCCLITGTQSSKTDGILDAIGWRLDTRPRPQLYIGPTEQMVSDMFEPRLMEMVRQSKRLLSLVARKGNSKVKKTIAGVSVRLGWAGSATSLASDQAGDVYVDEYDKMSGANSEADAFVLAKARADTYQDRKIVVTSTPTNGRVETEKCPVSGLEFWKVTDPKKVESPIWRRWQTGTRHHWAWRCPHCDEWFIPRYRNLRWEEGATPAQARRNTWLCCPVSGCVIEETHKAEMNAAGQFVAPGQTFNAAGILEGDPPDSSMLSLWVSGLASPFLTWGERVEELMNAEAAGDPLAVKAAINKTGELYSDIPVGATSPDAVLAKRAPYRMKEVPREVIRIVCGVDVQGDRLVYVIRGFGSRGRSWLVDADYLYGPTKDDAVWDSLADLLTADYGGLRIERAMIDSGFRPDKPGYGDVHKVYDFCRRFDWLAYPTKGRPTQTQPIVVKAHEVKPDGKRRPFSVNLVTVDTDFFKSLVMSRIITDTGKPQSIHLPQDISDDYCRQVVSEVREVEGRKVVWKKIYNDNHFLDCEALCAVAGRLLNVERIPEGVQRDWDPDAPSGAAPEEADAEPEVEITAKTVAASAPPKDLKLALRERMAARASRLNT